MNSSSIFPFSAKLIAELKVRLVKSSQHWLPKLGLCVLSLSGVTLQAYASNPSAPSADSSATKVAESKFDMSKVPPVTPIPRPGLFIMPPTSPGYYSLWDMVTGNKREKPPVAPYAPFALLPTSAYDIDFRYLDTPGHEKDIF
ncbi:MAG: alginate export family protein, partial [Pseudomonadota bacterium]